MGCGSCGSGANGKPNGCKSNGGCSTGGCNRMNVFDWLSTLPLHDSAKPYPIIEVSFNKGSRKDFFRNNTGLILDKGTWIAVEGTTGGFDVGEVSLTGELVKLQMKKYGVAEDTAMKRVMRIASEEDMQHHSTQKQREAEILIRSRAISRTYNLEMKLCEVEVQADGKKGTFFYTADQRVDFRELIKAYATEFKLKVEMRQIGARQESGKVGGIGSCGRELCCSTWLTDFKSVNTTAARYQNLSINQTKLSGQCGRLKCCLNYELDTYMDALRIFPDNAEAIQTAKGTATLQKRDIFKSLMWYSYSDSSKQYPLSIVRVKEILQLNKQGIKPEELQPEELETKAAKAGGVKVEMGFVNDVGQISLRALEKSSKKKKQGGNKQQNAQSNKPQPQGGNQQRSQPKQGEQKQAGPRQQQPKQGQPQKQGQPKQGGNQQSRNTEPRSGSQPRQQGEPKQGQQQRPPQQQRNTEAKPGGQQQGSGQRRPHGGRPDRRNNNNEGGGNREQNPPAPPPAQ